MRLDKAPKGKLPYIIDQGHAIGDTSLIIAHLKHTRGIDPDAGLTPRERAQALALQRLFEEHLYFIIVYSRWIDEEGWPLVAEAFFDSMPRPLRSVGPVLVPRAGAQDALHAGPGPARPAEIYAMGRADLEAIAEHLGDKPFFLGDRITTIDAVAYGYLANILLIPLETELKRMRASLPTLVDLVRGDGAGAHSRGTGPRPTAATSLRAPASGTRGDRRRHHQRRQPDEEPGLDEPGQRGEPEIVAAHRLVEMPGRPARRSPVPLGQASARRAAWPRSSGGAAPIRMAT